MIPYKQYNMKHTIAETKINKSNRSLISTIPNTIVSLESLTNTDGIRWSYEIVDNKHRYYVEFIKDIKNKNTIDENNRKTSSNIDDTTEKQDKPLIKHLSSIDTSSDTSPVTSETDNTSDESFEDTKKKLMKELHRDENGNSTIIKKALHETDEDETERYKELLSNNSHRITNKDDTYMISIQKNQRKTKLTFKLHFTTTINKDSVCRITYKDGSLTTSQKILSDLSKMNKDEINEFILKNNPNAKQKLEQYGLL